MTENEKKSLRQKMQEKDTEELLEIWKKNDRTEWTDIAFEVIRETLIERTGEVPPQNEFSSNLRELDESEADGDTYHSPRRIANIASIALPLSWFFLAWGIVFAVAMVIQELPRLGYDLNNLAIPSLLSALFVPSLPILLGILLFVLCRAVAEGLYLLMDIEDNTRRQ